MEPDYDDQQEYREDQLRDETQELDFDSDDEEGRRLDIADRVDDMNQAYGGNY